MINYNNKKFRPKNITANGEVDETTVFHYKQVGNILTCTYTSREIVFGHLLGIVSKNGIIDLRYHQINKNGEINTGICISKPTILENGKIQLEEKWNWTSGDLSKGKSTLIEI